MLTFTTVIILIYVYIYIYLIGLLSSELWTSLVMVIVSALRTIFLCMVTTALQGCWVIEQPGGSCFRYFPAFREFLLAMMKSCGGSAVTS